MSNCFRYLNSLQNEPLMSEIKLIIAHIEIMGFLVIRIQSIQSYIYAKLSLYS